MQAYARSPNPALVFNAARAYQEAGKPGDAAGLFRLYITISSDADGIAEAHERLRFLEGRAPIVAAQPAQAASPAEAPRVEPVIGLAKSASPAMDDGALLRWSVTGTAGLAAVSGIVLMVVAASDSKLANEKAIRNDANVTAYNSSFDRAERNWAIGASLTAVGVGLGAWAGWLHWRARSSRGSTVWQMDAGPSVARLTVNF
jgi:hypothetical protein